MGRSAKRILACRMLLVLSLVPAVHCGGSSGGILQDEGPDGGPDATCSASTCGQGGQDAGGGTDGAARADGTTADGASATDGGGTDGASASDGTAGLDATNGSDSGDLDVNAPDAACTNLQCDVTTTCGSGVNNGLNTSISGYVYDPAGNNPLPNVVVYVPNSAVQPLPVAPSNQCGACSSLRSGDPVALAVTDVTGHFTIANAPDNAGSPGVPIPLVVQIGKWRKQTSIAAVNPCTDNGGGIQKITLPAQADATDDLPQIAISTGGADTIECLLRRVGVSVNEYTRGAGGTGHIHVFQGSAANGEVAAKMDPDGGATPSSLASLFDTQTDLSPYDIVLLSCEGEPTVGTDAGDPLTATELAGLEAYANAGGRAFLSHYHYAWLDTGPFGADNIATWTPGANPINDESNNPLTSFTQGDFINADIVTTSPDGGPFPKGAAMRQWLQNVGALGDAGELRIAGAKHNADLNGLADTPSQASIAANASAVGEVEAYPGQPTSGTATPAAGATEYLSFDTPVGAAKDDAGVPAYCGRVVYSDIHVGAASGDYDNGSELPIVPDGCSTNPMSPQEKALEFMLFDLSSCVTPDTGVGSGG